MKKEQATMERQREAEFAAKCFKHSKGLENDANIIACAGPNGKDPFSML